MQATKLRPGTRRGGVIWLPVDELEPSPMQPRKNFPDGELQELSESIAQYGVLNPLTVRLRDGRYELVAGERRLRAARLAGLCDVPCILLDNGLTERHGRALLRLQDENMQRAALAYMIEHDLNVAAADAYIEALLREPEEKADPKRTFVMKDVRVFVNTILHGLDLMKQGGIAAGMKREETENELILTISIPKNKAE